MRIKVEPLTPSSAATAVAPLSRQRLRTAVFVASDGSIVPRFLVSGGVFDFVNDMRTLWTKETVAAKVQKCDAQELCQSYLPGARTGSLIQSSVEASTLSTLDFLLLVRSFARLIDC